MLFISFCIHLFFQYERSDGRIPLKYIRIISFQLLVVLEFFHAHSLIHTDIKSENVLLVDSTCIYDIVEVRIEK